MSESITGYIDHIIFRNEDNGYTVMVLKGGSEEDELTCVGSFPVVTQGASVELEGNFTQHPVYGKQFQAVRLTEKMPEDALAMERYLGSGAIKGIGAALAGRIVRHFGDDTFQIVENEPERLSEVKGISEKKAREIAMQIAEKSDMRKAMMFLQKYGISLNLGAKIYQKYGDSVYSVLQENPYRLADDISGVGFKIADEIAYRIGIHTDSDYRIKSGMVYTLLQATGEGHVYLPKDELFQRAAELLGVDSSYMEKHLVDLAMDRKIVQKEQGDQILIYPAQYYYLELNTARMLRELDIFCPEDEKIVERRIVQIEKETGTVLDEMQKKAVQEAAGHGLLILTGGPGTGKTTTINAIIRYFEGEGAEIRLAAPTGRAAKRMTEATGYEAQTIHRLLELSGMPEDDREGQPIHFERNAENPLETDVIIIDEMSMVDIHLIYSLLMAVTAGTRLILVGDENQLPSVGPGNVLRDIIRSGQFPVVELKKIFRQASESDIVVNAHKINKGEQVEINNKSRDFFFLKRYDADIIIRVVIALIQEKLPKYVEAKPFEIQVLTPMRKGLLGVERLNQILQRYLNPPDASKKEKEIGQGLFREGDKVMQVRNNYQLEWEIRGRYGIPIEKGVGVFNGDTGIIKTINEFAETAEVEFEDGRWAEYSFKQLDELELAYAVTIHKSQGSEYPAVIIPLLSGPRMLMNRNLLYTAVTRARKCVTVVGSEETFRDMIRNEKQQRRYSSLDQRIQETE
ncbi:ATP-dependent RecD-like DNA helicase [Blautia obeum]|jgi:exodeoxyribonuclease V alpha subunit|uniref:ATP-dependent RecD2 DNA helicase n=1 Tax=Blautia obeum TaxID=40520 RepID=A0A395X8J8_9FIRM|nr:ATP-dependent RecD-like DNA helicase [Blautia obeum]RGK91860.1 ATP-dependent RecD-like DNA helicase [Blautia obeum]RGV20986.1 ATP-dependent RecD-like DNA helicase [Blautia obeum]RGV62482.1 ATP-dependent RecD-like DNA helicase [Blautia obeum]